MSESISSHLGHAEQEGFILKSIRLLLTMHLSVLLFRNDLHSPHPEKRLVIQIHVRRCLLLFGTGSRSIFGSYGTSYLGCSRRGEISLFRDSVHTPQYTSLANYTSWEVSNIPLFKSSHLTLYNVLCLNCLRIAWLSYCRLIRDDKLEAPCSSSIWGLQRTWIGQMLLM